MKKTLFVFFICSLANLHALSAQDLPSQMIPREPQAVLSPNAASLGSYGNTQVSLFTGKPVITIPLYEINENGISIPIGLNYDSSGVRPDQKPGWVGLNWNLYAGGAITREVHDDPDEYPDKYESSFGYRLGYYWASQKITNDSRWNNLSYMRPRAQDASVVNSDTEPDEFHFSFLNYSGKFCLDHTGQWRIMSSEPLKISFDGVFKAPPFSRTVDNTKAYRESGHLPSFFQFTITDGYGIKYIFGGDTSAIEYSTSFFNPESQHWVATSWHLTRIEFPNKQIITFKYKRDPKHFTNQMMISVSSYSQAVHVKDKKPLTVGCSSYFSTNEITYSGQLIAPVYLEKIESLDTELNFHSSISNQLDYGRDIYKRLDDILYGGSEDYDTDHILPWLMDATDTKENYPENLKALKSYQLDSISIVKRNYKKLVHFNYSDSPNQRLTLNSVKESDKPSYVFTYKDMDRLPGYLSNKTDHWGFYNNRYAPVGYPASYHGYRKADPTVAQYGILDMIEYPTGGITQYIFEPHTYSKELAETRWVLEDRNINFHAGGLRIRRIIDRPVSGNDQEYSREYFYNTDTRVDPNQNASNPKLASLESYTLAGGDYASSGVLGGKAKYFFPGYTTKDVSYSNVTYTRDLFSTVSVLPSCFNTSGNHVGYSEVTEKFSDGSYVKYNFTNFDNGHLDDPADQVIQVSRTPYEPYSSKAQERGLLQCKKEYGADGIPVKSTEYQYEKDFTPDYFITENYVRSMRLNFENMCAPYMYDEGASYRIYLYTMRPRKTTTKYYNPEMTTSDMYTYERKLVTSVTTESPGVESRKTSYIYPFNCMNYEIYAVMTDIHFIKPVIEEIRYSGGKEILWTGTNYGYHNVGEIFTFLPYAVWKTNLDSRSTDYIIEYTNYDTYGHLLQSRDANGIPTTYIWGYNPGNGHGYLLASIENADLSTVKTCHGLSSISARPLYGGLPEQTEKEIRSLPDTQVITYDYNSPTSGGVSRITDPSNRSQFFDYDEHGRLNTVHDDGGFPVESYEYHYIFKN